MKKKKNDWNVLVMAVDQGNLQLVKYLMEKKANINEMNKSRRTALMLTCIKGHLEVV